MRRRLFLLLAFIIGGLVLFSLIKTLYGTYQGRQRLQKLEQEVADLEAKKNDLANRLQERQSDEFVEQEARNKLNFVYPNETLVVIPDTLKSDKKEEGLSKLDVRLKEINRLTHKEQWLYVFELLRE